MPSNGFTFAILISCEIERVGVLHRCFQLFDLFFLVARHHIQRLEVVLDIDAKAGPLLAFVCLRHICGAARQVADVADR